jgi:hypothetical protein
MATVNGLKKTATAMLICGVHASSVAVELLPGRSATAEVLP